MRLSIKRSPQWFLVGILSGAIFLLSIFMIIGAKVNAASREPVDGQKVVNIYNGDDKIVVVTDAKTVGEVLKRAKIEIDSTDIVEPSRDTKFDSKDYTVNIYRSKPVTIVDGARKERVLTPYSTAEDIVKYSDFKIRKEDKLTIKKSDNILLDGVSEQVVIDRATPIMVVLYGKKQEFYTHAETVADFLKDNKIELGKDDDVSVSRDTKIAKNMNFEIWRNGVQTKTEEQEIDFPVRKIQDADKEVGYSKVQTPGEKGKKDVTYEVNMKNGKEIARKEVQSVVVKQPVEQVEVVGIKRKPVGYAGGGSKDEWLQASGIDPSKWGYVDAIVSRESGWNPNATNPSGACGLAQALPCGKVGGGGGYDPVSSLRWMDSYVKGRYGGWSGAYSYWQTHHWY